MKICIALASILLALELTGCSSKFPGDYRGQLSMNLNDASGRPRTVVGQVKALVIQKDKEHHVSFSDTALITGCTLVEGRGGGQSCTISDHDGVAYSLKVDDVRLTKNGDGIIISIDGTTNGSKDFARITFVQ